MSAPPGWAEPLARWRARVISPQVALAQLVMGADGVSVVPTLERVAASQGELGELVTLAHLHADRLVELERVVAEGLSPAPADTPAARHAATAALFDRLATRAPDAAVAIYSLGDSGLLARATEELVTVVEAWAPLSGRAVLDWGCGTGRVAAALAPQVASMLGVDLSAGMIAEAIRRHGSDPRLRFVHAPDLSAVPDESVDLALAVDSLPFAVSAGEDVAARAIADLRRVLRPGGDLLVFNWSYRGDPALDEADAQSLPGYDVVRAGERPFRIWDGVGFHLRRR